MKLNPFNKQATAAEVKKFTAGKRMPARAAVAKAQAPRVRQAAGGSSLAAQSAAWKKKQAKQQRRQS